MGKFVVKVAKTGFMFNLKAGNGEIIGTSEIYTTKAMCLHGIDSVRGNVGSPVDDTTKETDALVNPKYEVYVDASGQFRFHLKARNGEIILTSEAYTTKAMCLHGIESVKHNAPDAPVEEEPVC